MSVYNVALTSCAPNLKKKHHSDVAIMTESQQCRLSETFCKAPGVSSHRCCLYNVNVGADAVALLAIWNTAVIFEKSE